MRMAMAFLIQADFHPEFPPLGGTLTASFRGIETSETIRELLKERAAIHTRAS
jgi:hypothetical protein